jgi:enoyl-CoA hydratase/carnithine racemase
MSAEVRVIEHPSRAGSVWELANQSRHNAVTSAMLAWIEDRCASLRGEIVVLRGADGGSFCAGFDLTELAAAGDRVPDASLPAATAAMARADATFVAEIRGHAIGAGVELAAACDFRLAGDDASFRVPAGRLCVVYHAEGLRRIRAAFGPVLTRRLLLAGETVPAAAAAAAGALHACVEPARLRAATESLVAQLAEQAPASLRGNRAFLRALDEGAADPAFEAAHEAARRAAYASEDHAEARASLREGRSPRWGGC